VHIRTVLFAQVTEYLLKNSQAVKKWCGLKKPGCVALLSKIISINIIAAILGRYL